MVKENFNSNDIRAIEEDIKLNFGDGLFARVVVVTQMEKTSRGKHRKLAQRLDLSLYL